MNDWLKFSDDELSDYLNRELEYIDKGQLKSNTTSKKFYKRNINTDFVEVNAEDIPF